MRSGRRNKWHGRVASGAGTRRSREMRVAAREVLVHRFIDVFVEGAINFFTCRDLNSQSHVTPMCHQGFMLTVTVVAWFARRQVIGRPT